MASKRWKVIELQKCRELGGERTGPTGRDLPDCVDICVGLEVKSYKTFVWLTEDWRQAKENAEKVGQHPVLALKERGHNGRDRVQMHSALWIMLETGAMTGGMDAFGEVTTHEVDGDEVARMDWDYFVRLYDEFYRKD